MCAVLDCHLVASNDYTPSTAGRGACIKFSADDDLAVLHVGDEEDAAGFVLDGLGLNDAAVIDRCHPEVVGGLGGHHHHSAVRLDEPLVLDERIDRSPVDDVVDKAVTGKVKRDLVSGGNEDTATIGSNAPFVGDLGGDQNCHTSILDLDGAKVEDGTSAFSVREPVFCGKKVAVEHVKR